MTGITTAKIPIIDFAPFKGGDVSIRQAIATEVYRACHETGFMYLKNIGIDPDLIAKTMMRSQQFF
ncbi:MAG: 2-oxoglutarate and iron-dependent oxygenase domain-containing protein, partial [Cyanobacteria bacterium J06631_6]